MYKISYNLMPSLQITCSIVCMKPKFGVGVKKPLLV